MTKTIDEKEAFIALRAQGYSFDKIAKKIGVSKPTLISWQADFDEQIKEARYFEVENIINKYELMRNTRFEAHARLLKKAIDELINRGDDTELECLPVKDLLSLIDTLEKRLTKDMDQTNLTVEVPDDFLIDRFDTKRETVQIG